MDLGTGVNTYVFLLAFASAFLLGGRRPLLALSTRCLLVVLLGLALGYAVSQGRWYHPSLGIATIVANLLFIAFAAIDFYGWQKNRAAP